MKNFRDLTVQEMKTINGGGWVNNIAGILGTVRSVAGWLTKNGPAIINTISNGVKAIGAFFAGIRGL